MTDRAALVAQLMDGAAPLLADPPRGVDVTVLLPTDMDPFDRHYRFAIHLDAELRLAGAGCDTGGGTLYLDGGDDDELVFTILDIDAVDVPLARAVLRLHLPELGCLAGTMIHWGDGGEDRFDGTTWLLDQPRSSLGVED